MSSSPYNEVGWVDGPLGGTPLDAAELGVMDQGIADEDLRNPASPASLAAAALYGHDVRAWAPNTPYIAGQAVVSPTTGDLVTAKTNHTSSTTYSGTGVGGNWNLSTTFAAAATAVVSVAAPTGVAATDTATIQAAIDAANAAGGGAVRLRAGRYIVNGLLIRTGVRLSGAGEAVTTIQLANGANTDLITVPNFATLTGTNGSGGESGWAIADVTLDGNGSNQAGTSWTLRVYASNYRIMNVEIVNGLTGNAYSEWGTAGGGDMEAYWANFKIRTPQGSGAVNLDFRGPHDSVFVTGEVVAGTSGLLQTGIWDHGNGGANYTGVHVWGYHQNGWVAEKESMAANCRSEGAQNINLLVRNGQVRWSGKVYGTNDTHTGEIGVQIGDTGFTGLAGASLDVDLFQFGATSHALNFVSTSGENRVYGRWTKGTSAALYLNAPANRDEVWMICPDNPASSVHELGHAMTFDAFDSQTFLVKIAGSATFEIVSAALINYYHGLLLRGYTGLAGSTQTWQLDASLGAIQPGTSAGLGGRIFSGAGAPTISATSGDIYIRTGTPTVANQRIYICTGTTNWTGIV